MKIQCDVCEKKEAIVFCGADEAALCQGCDHRVHFANKLASKHLRFSLLHPSFKDPPLCDICQEKRAFLLCKEDRAILCRECDNSIHKANEHTLTHHRLLLTGVQISSSSTPYANSSPNSTTTNSSSQPNSNSINSNSTKNTNNSKIASSTTTNYSQINEDGAISTNNTMPDYFVDTNMSGWRLEDLLDSSYATPSKTFEYNQKPEVEESMGSFSSTEEYSRLWDFHQPGSFLPSHFL